MDPITLIVTALTAGATAALQGTAEQAVKDAYSGLKALIKRKFAGKPVAESVDRHESAPDVLKEQLKDAGAGDDEEIIRAAQTVLAQTDPDGARAGKYNVTISNGKGVVVGDRNTVTMTFND